MSSQVVEIGKALVSFDIFERKFLCDISKCKGACCVEGESGAPLTEEEAKIIEEIYPVIEPYLDEKYKEEIQKQGFSIEDEDGDLVTPIINGKECVYTMVEDGITKCAIEKAYFEGKVSFRKPVSCHLFPIRITEYESFDAVNYQQLDICSSARICGVRQQLPLYKFLKEPLIRKYGEEWYEQLEVAAELLQEK